MSDFFYFLVAYIIRYRKNVIDENLSNSFPNKSADEIKKIRRLYYRHFSDVICEMLISPLINEKEYDRRISFNNFDLMESAYDSKLSTVVFTSHYGNWEWLLLAADRKMKHQVLAVYQKIKNPFFDRHMQKLRTRFGAVAVERKQLLRKLIEYKSQIVCVAMVADQAPRNPNEKLIIDFLNQETAFFQGASKITHRMNYIPIYVSIKRLKRGFYEVSFTALPLAKKATVEHISTQYAKLLEDDINSQPEQWLWSHRRWKPLDVIDSPTTINKN
ncbi:MAG: lysophospholipid acyltransferase family protein [Cyclobacteriaceae bacterium]|nr:lysophospholipid acyltransferase family protein [Cyclobacteriaceae bacterium]